MPLPNTPDNALHKLLHDRYSTTRHTGERALLSLILQHLHQLKQHHQESSIQIRSLLRDIQHTESQIRSISSLTLDRYVECKDTRFSADDGRIINCLNERLCHLDKRLGMIRQEVNQMEVRFNDMVTCWATNKF